MTASTGKYSVYQVSWNAIANVICYVSILLCFYLAFFSHCKTKASVKAKNHSILKSLTNNPRYNIHQTIFEWLQWLCHQHDCYLQQGNISLAFLSSGDENYMDR